MLFVDSTWLPVVAAFIPVLTALALHQSSANKARALVAVVASAVLAVVSVIVEDNGFTFETLGATFAEVFIVQLTSYVGIWGSLFSINDRVMPEVGLRIGAVVDEV